MALLEGKHRHSLKVYRFKCVAVFSSHIPLLLRRLAQIKAEEGEPVFQLHSLRLAAVLTLTQPAWVFSLHLVDLASLSINLLALLSGTDKRQMQIDFVCCASNASYCMIIVELNSELQTNVKGTSGLPWFLYLLTL